MKRLQIALIGIIGAVMVFLCVVLGIFLTREKPSGAGHGKYSLVQEKKFRAEDIQRLKIDYGKGFAGATDVLLYQSAGDEIIVREYMDFEPKQSQLSDLEQSGGELSIKGAGQGWLSFLFFSFRGAYTEVWLPADFAREMDALTVKTVSGDISSEIGLKIRNGFTVSTTSGDMLFPEVQAQKICASSTSGNLRLGSAEADTLDITTTSGDVTLEQAQGETKISSTSGNLRLDSAEADTLDITTTSGDITVKQARGKTKISSTSGEIQVRSLEGTVNTSTTSGDISLGKVTGAVNLSTSSGSIRLEEGQDGLDAESTSGDIQVGLLKGEFRMDTTSGEIVLSDGACAGKAHSVSGDIRICLAELSGNLDVSTTSGAAELQLPKTADFQFRFNTSSGDCQTFFQEALSFDGKRRNAKGQYGGGAHSVEISTVSGDLEVEAFPE